MPSPFPGMDPYLEGELWPDVHQELASVIRAELTPKLRPRYAARLVPRTVRDSQPEEEIGITYPDLAILKRRTESVSGAAMPTASSPTPAALVVAALPEVFTKVVAVHIREIQSNKLVAAVEIISPINKRGDGLKDFRKKRQRLRSAGVHLLEIDLLRRGTRVVPGNRVPDCDYLVSLTRSRTNQTELWPLSIRDGLPVLPVPLRKGDADVLLSLSGCFATAYGNAAYEDSIDYAADPPPPELSAEDRAWIRARVAERSPRY